MRAKVTIIGAGHVGATTAHLLVQSGLADVVLFDVVEGVPQGKALDLSEAVPLWNVSSKVTGTNSYEDTAGSDVVVITAGFPRKPGMSRDDLLIANAEVVAGAVKKASHRSPECRFIVVTNPVDVMTNLAWRESKVEPRRVMGMGGVLDAARFRTFISVELNVSPEDIETLVLGGHGDLMVPLPGSTSVKGVPLKRLMSVERIDKLIQRTKNGGAEIVSLLKTGSAYYAPAAAIFQMISSVLLDEHRLLPCSAYVDGQFGLSGFFVGVPAILGGRGVERIVELELSETEKADFDRSAAAVKAALNNLIR
jgi:malate dehydrogenase